ncbi:MAG: efflux RND transporter periplasmic adaptor subunit [Reyranella sp.]|nr:efflux RND transporter periplasmic adaptor subunit [Reyranella sp.]
MTDGTPSSRPAPRRNYRLWLGAGALIAIGLAGLWWLGLPPFNVPTGQESRGRASGPSAAVSTDLTEQQVAVLKIAAVGQARFQIERNAVGNIDFNQNLLVQVFTPNPGRIIATYANVGDRVEKGQVLFTVDSPDLLNAASNLVQAAGVLVLQNANLKRLTETLKGGGGAQKDLDQVISDQQAAEGNLRAARDTVRIFGKTDDEIDQIIKGRKPDNILVVRSPVSGLVTQRTAAPGLYLQPGNAPAPFTVADTSIMWMLANVVESDAPLFRVGQPLAVRVTAWPDREFKGAVAVVGAQIDPNTRRLMVRSEIEDPERRLTAGMFANFIIRLGVPFEATAVPDRAVVREPDGSMSVWVTTDRRRFEKRKARVGLVQSGMSQILEGLRQGELVVTEGAIFVSNKASGSGVPD